MDLKHKSSNLNAAHAKLDNIVLFIVIVFQIHL